MFTVNLDFTDLLFSLKKMLGEKEEGEREKTQIVRKQPAGYMGRGVGGQSRMFPPMDGQRDTVLEDTLPCLGMMAQGFQ